MPDFYEKITEMQVGLEQLIRRVPGFKGYFEVQDRRAADRLLREKLVEAFSEQLDEFTRLQKRLIEGGGMKYMERVRAIDSRLRVFLDKIESAASGYTGLFDSTKVDAAALVRVYGFDNALFVYQDQLARGLKRFGEAVGSETMDDVLVELEVLVDEVINVFNRRGEVMRDLQDHAQ